MGQFDPGLGAKKDEMKISITADCSMLGFKRAQSITLGTKPVSASKQRVLVTKAVADVKEATLRKIDANLAEDFCKLICRWGHVEVVSVRSLQETSLVPMSMSLMCV